MLKYGQKLKKHITCYVFRVADLSKKKSNMPEAEPFRKPQEILGEIKALDDESKSILDKIKDLM